MSAAPTGTPSASDSGGADSGDAAEVLAPGTRSPTPMQWCEWSEERGGSERSPGAAGRGRGSESPAEVGRGEIYHGGRAYPAAAGFVGCAGRDGRGCAGGWPDVPPAVVAAAGGPAVLVCQCRPGPPAMAVDVAGARAAVGGSAGLAALARDALGDPWAGRAPRRVE